jgi:hypothetical protein
MVPNKYKNPPIPAKKSNMNPSKSYRMFFNTVFSGFIMTRTHFQVWDVTITAEPIMKRLKPKSRLSVTGMKKIEPKR